LSVVLLGSFLLSQKEATLETSYELVWSDEFDYQGLPDADKWSYDVGDGCPLVCGWGNRELEYYTRALESNARVKEGSLIIEAHKQRFINKDYTSARLVSKGKGDWKYGKIEVRAKNPTGKGTWPAIWMLPTDNEYGTWPKSGEIDIMEHVGYEPEKIYGTVHTSTYNHMIGTQKGGEKDILDSESAFHKYGILWTEDKIDFMIDDEIYFTFDNDHTDSNAWPFDQRFHLIMNIAVGGNWGGKFGIDDNIWPQRMEVDYVRVYQKL